MEACHRCFEPLQRRQRTLLERLFLARVLYCSTCNRKTRFLHEGILRFLGRVEWLLNVYTTCAHCGFPHVVRVAPADEASDEQSTRTSIKAALRPPTYRCERCEATYGDFRPPRVVVAPAPAPRARQVVRLSRVDMPEDTAPVMPRLALPAAADASPAAAFEINDLPLTRAAFVEGAPSLTITEWERTPFTAAPAFIDVEREPERAPAPAPAAIPEPLVTMETVAADEENWVDAVVSEAFADPAPPPVVASVTFEELPLAAATVPSVEETVLRAAAPSAPSLDLIVTPPSLEPSSQTMADAEAEERAVRSGLERARLEALLAAFERHAADRRRGQSSPARATQGARTSAPQPFTPQPSTPRTPVPSLAH